MKTGFYNTSMRMPMEVYEKIKQESDDNFRSVNSQVSLILSEWVSRKQRARKVKQDERNIDQPA